MELTMASPNGSRLRQPRCRGDDGDVEADVEKLVAATVERFGQLDCAFYNE
jgi:hypothetical protein